MTRRPAPRRTTALVAVVLTVVALPAAATTARDQLDDQRAGLEAALARVDDLAADVDAADARLVETATGLAELQVRLDAARAEAEAAEARAAEASRAMALAAGDLDARADALAAAQQDVDDRAATLWMRGTATDRALVSGLLGAGELHDVFVRVQGLGRIAEADRAALAGALDVALAQARDRDALGRVRSRAAAATATAVGARRDAQDLLARQQRLLAEAAEATRERRAALAALEQDVDARRALVAELSLRLREQQLASLEEWLAEREDLAIDGPPPEWADRLPAAGRTWAPAIVHAAGVAGIDPRLLAALVWTESSFRPDAVSPSGAIGLAQLMPATARGLGVDPWDPIANLVGGATYLRMQLDRFGRVDLALAAYNAGPTRVAQAGPGIPSIVETELYVLRVLERVQHIRGG